MKAKDFKNKTKEELQTELLSLLQEQFNLRMQKGSADKNLHPKQHSFKNVRRNIARIKTFLKQK